MKSILTALVVGVALSGSGTQAQESDPNAEPICLLETNSFTKLQDSLSDQVEMIEMLEHNIFSIDRGRLLYVKDSVQAIQQNIMDNSMNGLSPVTMKTLKLAQTLMIKYRHSTVFFGWQSKPSVDSIYSEVNAPTLKKLHARYEEMVAMFDFEDSPYLTITESTFEDIKKLLDQLEQMDLDSELRNSLKALLPTVGATIAIAKQGDGPCTFIAGQKAVKAIRDLYTQFEEVAASRPGYGLILQLQGANEFYSEYSQTDLMITPGVCK